MKRLSILTKRSTYITTLLLSTGFIYLKDHIEVLFLLKGGIGPQFTTLILQLSTTDFYMTIL